MAKNNDAYKNAHILEKIDNYAKELVNNISSSVEKGMNEIVDISETAGEEISVITEDAGGDILNAETISQKKIISAEQRYADEKIRIEKKRKEQSEALNKAEFQEKLAAASDAEKAAKLIREENFRLEKAADDEYLEELKNAAEKEKIIREKEFSSLKNSFDLGYITQEEYYSRLGELRDKYFESDSNEWAEYTKQINDYHISALNDLKDYIKNYEKQLENLRGRIENKLSDYTNLYTKKTTTYKKAGPFGSNIKFTSYSLNDLSEETKKIREYADTLESVKNRGALPKGFFDEIRNMSIDEGISFAKLLLNASDDEFEEYINSYAEMQKEIAQITTEFTEDEAADMVSSISSELEKYYDVIPEGFFECGKLSGENFTSAFLSELNSLSDGLNSILPYSGIFSPSNQSAASNSYSSVYNLYSSAQSISEQLREARAASELERMRGGY